VAPRADTHLKFKNLAVFRWWWWMSFKEKEGEEGEGKKRKEKRSLPHNKIQTKRFTMMARFVDYLSLPTATMKVLLDRPVDTLILF
jgi:hypothetical protein